MIVKNFLKLFLVALMAFPILGYAAQPPAKTGSLKIKAGVVLNSGDVKYVAKQPFFLSRKSFFSEALAASQNTISLEDWAASKGASPQLVEYFRELPEAEKKRAGSGYSFPSNKEKVLSMPDIPEFDGLKRAARLNCGEIDDVFVRYDCLKTEWDADKTLPDWLRFNTNDTYRHSTQHAEIINNTKIISSLESSALATCMTDFTGACEFKAIPQGQYYLISAGTVTIHPNKVLWDIPVTVTAGKAGYIELGNDNLREASTFPRSWEDLE